jgi:hypothetical protein
MDALELLIVTFSTGASAVAWASCCAGCSTLALASTFSNFLFSDPPRFCHDFFGHDPERRFRRSKSHLFLLPAGNRKRLGELVDFRRSRFLAGRNVHQLWRRRSQCLVVGRFRRRIRNRPCGQFGWGCNALDNGNLLLNGDRKAFRGVHKQVQRAVSEYRRDQGKENYQPKNPDHHLKIRRGGAVPDSGKRLVCQIKSME